MLDGSAGQCQCSAAPVWVHAHVLWALGCKASTHRLPIACAAGLSKRPRPPTRLSVCCRRPALPYSTFLFFPLLYGASQSGRYEKAPAVDMQKAAMLNNSTVANVRCRRQRSACERSSL